MWRTILPFTSEGDDTRPWIKNFEFLRNLIFIQFNFSMNYPWFFDEWPLHRTNTPGHPLPYIYSIHFYAYKIIKRHTTYTSVSNPMILYILTSFIYCSCIAVCMHFPLAQLLDQSYAMDKVTCLWKYDVDQCGFNHAIPIHIEFRTTCTIWLIAFNPFESESAGIRHLPRPKWWMA